MVDDVRFLFSNQPGSHLGCRPSLHKLIWCKTWLFDYLYCSGQTSSSCWLVVWTSNRSRDNSYVKSTQKHHLASQAREKTNFNLIFVEPGWWRNLAWATCTRIDKERMKFLMKKVGSYRFSQTMCKYGYIKRINVGLRSACGYFVFFKKRNTSKWWDMKWLKSI